MKKMNQLVAKDKPYSVNIALTFYGIYGKLYIFVARWCEGKNMGEWDKTMLSWKRNAVARSGRINTYVTYYNSIMFFENISDGVKKA